MATRRQRQQALEMIGELFREAAVLIGVLAPMETIIGGRGLTIQSVIVIVVLSGFLGGVGLYLGLKNAE